LIKFFITLVLCTQIYLHIERVAQQRDVERVFEQQMCSVMIAEVFTCFALGYPYPQADSI